MGFKKTLFNDAVPEWREKYIDYAVLRAKLEVAHVTALRLVEESDSGCVNATLEDVPESAEFFAELATGIEMVETFYKDLMAYFAAEFDVLVAHATQLGLSRPLHSLRASQELPRSSEVSGIQGPGIKINPRPMKNWQKNTHLHEPTAVLLAEGKQLPDTDLRLQDRKVSTLSDLRASFAEFYRGLLLVQSYAQLNLAAVLHLLETHDKLLGTSCCNSFLEGTLTKLEFPKHSSLLALISECEYSFSMLFFGGYCSAAMSALRVPKHGVSWPRILRIGTLVGLALALFAQLLYMQLVQHTQSVFPRHSSMIIVYRLLGMIVLVLWAWAVDMWVWRKYRIDYLFIFQFDTRKSVHPDNVFEAAAVFTLMWVLSALFYTISSVDPIGFDWLSTLLWQVHPAVLFLCTIGWMIYFQVQSNFWLLRTLAGVVAAPFVTVQFRHIFLADQLVSIVIILLDLEYTICFFAYDAWVDQDHCSAANLIIKPILVILPNLFRFLQCLRQYHDKGDHMYIVNAGKYSTGFVVATLSALRAAYQGNGLLFAWVGSLIVSTFYTYFWDILRDWGLGHRRYCFLRKTRIYSTWLYYWALASNLGFRLMWTFTISPGSIGQLMDPAAFSAILAAVEILRRAQWNLLRLEVEHIKNIEKLRAIDIEVPGLHIGQIWQDVHVPRVLLITGNENLRKSQQIPLEEAVFFSSDEASVPLLAGSNTIQ